MSDAGKRLAALERTVDALLIRVGDLELAQARQIQPPPDPHQPSRLAYWLRWLDSRARTGQKTCRPDK